MELFEVVIALICYWTIVLGFAVGASVAAIASWLVLGHLDYTLISISGLVGVVLVFIVFGKSSVNRTNSEKT